MTSPSIARNIIESCLAKLHLATIEGREGDFYFDDADREGLKMLCEISRKNGSLPPEIEAMAIKLGFLDEKKEEPTC